MREIIARRRCWLLFILLHFCEWLFYALFYTKSEINSIHFFTRYGIYIKKKSKQFAWSIVRWFCIVELGISNFSAFAVLLIPTHRVFRYTYDVLSCSISTVVRVSDSRPKGSSSIPCQSTLRLFFKNINFEKIREELQWRWKVLFRAAVTSKSVTQSCSDGKKCAWLWVPWKDGHCTVQHRVRKQCISPVNRE